MLVNARRSLAAFLKSRWLVNHVVLGEKARVSLGAISIMDARQPDFRGEAFRGLRYRGLYHAAACFEQDDLSYYDVGVLLPRHTQGNGWLLLGNGDLILNQAAPEETLPEGSILRPDGSVEFPSSSLPC